MNEMNALEFVAAITSTCAWPAAILAIVLILKWESRKK